ncbi:MAG: hypothetical protein C0467_31085 [Planctomycetaceae bacterium]|nr:hypothetical protein [Planctomycetaceae bacterium]
MRRDCHPPPATKAAAAKLPWPPLLNPRAQTTKRLCFWIAAIVVMSVLSASATEPQKSFRETAIRSEDQMLAASGIPADNRDKAARERVLTHSTNELKAESIDFQKQMILNLQLDFSPTP